MTLSPRIAIRQSQKLVLNPQMQQSIELLLLSNKQLAQMLKKETEQNPFLAFDTQHYREATASKVQTQEAQTPDVYEAMTDFAEAEGGNAGDVIEQRQAEPENGGLLPHVLGQIGEMFDDRQMALWAGELAGWLDLLRGVAPDRFHPQDFVPRRFDCGCDGADLRLCDWK